MEEKQMTELKAGDKVRCIEGDPHWDLQEGRTYTVASGSEFSGLRLRELVGTKGERIDWSSSRFTPAQSELEQLVATANAGLDACKRLYTEFQDAIEQDR